MIAVAYLCPTCLVEADEPYCSICGLDLSQKTTEPVGIPTEDTPTGSEEVEST